MRRIQLYDTTLRDGAQSEDVSFTLEYKLRIAERLDDLGVHYIEGGWPGSNPKDMRFFRRIQDVPLKHARVAAFGARRFLARKLAGLLVPIGAARGHTPHVDREWIEDDLLGFGAVLAEDRAQRLVTIDQLVESLLQGGRV